MTTDSPKKIALITGGSRGIGFGIASALASEGWDLAISGRRSETDVAPAMDALRNLGADVLYVVADVADREARDATIAAVRSHFGRLNMLVNNAGVGPKDRVGMLEATEESFDTVLAVYLKGPYFLTQAAAQWMLEQKAADPDFTGLIVNISSISATTASVSRGEYCVAKAGLGMATSLWAVALAEHGIAVYEIRPGIIHTDMTAGVTEKYDALIADGLVLQERWGEPEDVGKAVAMLARGDLPYSTGAVIPVDGGFLIPRV